MNFLSVIKRPMARIIAQSKAEEREGLAAKIDATIVRHKATSELAQAKALSSKAKEINYRNHFSESLGEAFSGKERRA